MMDSAPTTTEYLETKVRARTDFIIFGKNLTFSHSVYILIKYRNFCHSTLTKIGLPRRETFAETENRDGEGFFSFPQFGASNIHNFAAQFESSFSSPDFSHFNGGKESFTTSNYDRDDDSTFYVDDYYKDEGTSYDSPNYYEDNQYDDTPHSSFGFPNTYESANDIASGL